MNPEIKLFVEELRKGKSLVDASVAYCWAKCAVPIRRADAATHSPMECPPCIYDAACFAYAFDAFTDGATDAEISEAFYRGTEFDNDVFGIIWRELERSERPSFGKLIRSMDIDSQMKAAELFGLTRVANAIAQGHQPNRGFKQ